MIRISAVVLCALLFGLLSPSALSEQCPTGSYQTVDQWGNKICKEFGSGGATKSIEGRINQCPTGTYSTVDSWGNRVCKEMKGDGRGKEYHDTSRGCPVGSYQTVDQWGNKVCKRF